MIKANLLHLSYNMWGDLEAPDDPNLSQHRRDTSYHPAMYFDQKVWQACLAAMAEAKLNLLLIDLGDAVHYRSHPELAIDGAWSPSKLRDELARCRDLGLEPIPKLNFAATHDTWLRPYDRMVSTDTYYGVVRDLIHEVAELFDGPRLFHLGMDEETAAHQRWQQHVVIRQHDLIWHDLHFLFDTTRAVGARPWIWSDMIWHLEDRGLFAERMPKDVLQSNWYYGDVFHGGDAVPVEAFAWLDELGYEQVPTGSNWSSDENIRELVEHCRRVIAPERLAGFMMADWRPTIPAWQKTHLEAIRQTGEAVR